MTVETETEAATTVAETISTTTTPAREGGTSQSKEEVLASQLDEQIQKGAKYRQANTEYKARIVELEKEAQRAAELEEQVSKLTTSHRQEITLARLEALATKEGLVDPDDIKLIDLSTVKYDKEGKPENLAELLAGFKEAKPHKFGSVATSSSVKAPTPDKATKGDTAAGMSKDEFARWSKENGI